MRLKLVAASFVLLITQVALAGGHANPTACPAVDAFKNTGVSSVMREQDGTWLTLKWKNNFSTEHEWTLVVGNITADFPSDALAKGNAAISALVYKHGPVNMGSEQNPMWICVYQDPNSDVMGGAFTPSLKPEITKAVKLLHRK